MLQYRHYPVDRPSTLCLQQRLVLCMDGHDQAAFRYCLHNHDILVGSPEDEDQWRREHERTTEEDGGWQARMRLSRTYRLDFEPPGVFHQHAF